MDGQPNTAFPDLEDEALSEETAGASSQASLSLEPEAEAPSKETAVAASQASLSMVGLGREAPNPLAGQSDLISPASQPSLIT